MTGAIDTQELNSTLIKDLGLEGFPREVQDEVLGQLGENILRKITLSIVDKIPLTNRQEFDSISEAGDGDRMQAFLNAHIPDFENFVKDEVKKSVDEFKQIAAAA